MPLATVASVTDRAKAYPCWYALRVRANHERAVSQDLRLAGVPEFCPTYRTESRWTDRAKTIERPLFPGYLFVLATSRQLERVNQTRGVVQVLPNSIQPIAIAAEEIEAIRTLVTSPQLKAQPSDYQPGESVKVESGPLAGHSGVIARTKGGRRLIVTIAFIGRSVSVELDADTVTRANEKEAAAAAA